MNCSILGNERSSHHETIPSKPFPGVQGQGRLAGDPRRQDAGRTGATVPDPRHADRCLETAVARARRRAVRPRSESGAGLPRACARAARQDRGADHGARFFVQRARALPRPERQALIDAEAKMPITTQCQLLGLSRSSAYYRPRGVSEADLTLMRRLDERHLEHPFLGARKLARLLKVSTSLEFSSERS